MTRSAAVASLFCFAVTAVVACSSDPTSSSDASPETTAAASAACVDFVVTEEDRRCTVAVDCTFVDATRVCAGDPSCSGQIPTNIAGRTRYARETAAISRTQTSCGAPAREACVAGRCVVCSAPADCPDGG